MLNNNKNKPLVVIVQRILPHYRLPFFRLLQGSNPNIDIRVFHGDQSVDSIHSTGFESHYYRNYYYSFLGFSLVFQPSLLVDIIRKSPDLLILEGTFGILTNLLLLVVRRMEHLPSIYWTAGWDNPAIKGRRAQLKSFLIHLFLKMPDGAIAYGSSARNYLIAHGLSESKIVVAQNTIDVETIMAERLLWMQRGKALRNSIAKNVDHLIVYIGHLGPLKRANVLLRAFHLLRKKNDNMALLIVGNGEQMGVLKHYIDLHHIPDVYCVGEIVEGVESYFAAGDVFVMPGTGGLAINQAMALGLPVIATVADGTQNDLIVQGVNGYIVPVDDVDALSAAITDILTTPGRQKSMGQRSLEILQERATLKNMVEQYSKAIQMHCLRAETNLKVDKK
jgi:glycosyltransferase involved in cell wall biosynthesis